MQVSKAQEDTWDWVGQPGHYILTYAKQQP